jgi:hypothetical protein
MGRSAWQEFETSARRIEKAISAGSMCARPDAHFTMTQRPLDERGWQGIVRGIDGLRRRASAEENAARRRMAEAGEKPIPTTLLLAAFESPARWDDPGSALEDDRWQVVDDPTPSGPSGLSQAARAEILASPIRMDVMAQAAKGPTSPAAFAQRRGGIAVEEAVHHFEALQRHGWLRQVEEAGAMASPSRSQRLYRVGRALVVSTEEWSTLSSSERAVIVAKTFEECFEQVREALEAGTFEAREDRRYDCPTIHLDRQGWVRVIAMIDTLFEFVVGECMRAKARLATSGEDPFLATCVLMAFESPGGPRKPPRPLGHLQLQSRPAGYRPVTSRPTLRTLK